MRVYYKIALFFVLALFVILSSVFFYFKGYYNQEYTSNLEQDLRKKAKLSLLILNNNSQNDEILADQISKTLGLRVTIIDLSGNVLGDSDFKGAELKNLDNHIGRAEIQQAIKNGEGLSRRFSTSLKKDIFYYAVVANDTSVKPRIIRLSMPISDIDIISKSTQVFLLSVLLPAFLVGVILVYIFVFFVTRPMEKLLSQAREISKGEEFYRRFPIMNGNETEKLAKVFNRMLDKMEAKINEVTEANSKFSAVIFSMFDAVMVLDKNGSIRLINKKCSEFFDIVEDPVGKKAEEITKLMFLRDIYEKAFKSGSTITEELSLVFPKDANVLVHATPILSDVGKTGVVIVFNDITEIRRLESVRKDFVANVSHELRTPISSIKGYSETLVNGAIDDVHNAKDFVKIIYNESVRLADLINDLLDLSKIESGHFALRLHFSSPHDLVENAINAVSKVAAERGIKILNKVSKKLPAIKLDQGLMLQVFFNLIHNAVKYNHDGVGTVTISADYNDKNIVFRIIDNGVGISEKDIPRIFERFYRVDKARSRDLGGTGLGLAIVKHIVQLHNGGISVKSIEGKGSEFIFTIPANLG